jgi:phenylpropionate dioxygenase-like ring-hydroxylating dioxygenase large terminal subunit
MNAQDILPGWYAVALHRRLKEKPIRIRLAGAELRIWRGAEGPPWAEDAMTRTQRVAVVQNGWVYVAQGNPTKGPQEAPLLPSVHSILDIEGHVGAGIGDVAENILDTTHTSVVHQGYLRTETARRPVEAILQTGEGWVSATYPPGAAPSGWGARMLGAHRYTITDTFRAPATAEVSYTEADAPVFTARFRLTPVGPLETYVAATLAVPGRGPVAALKLAALRLFFLRIFAEDRAILEQISANRAAHGVAPLVFAPQDLLRPGIEAILSGRAPAAPAMRIALKV